MTLAKWLFKHRLLPSRHEARLDHVFFLRRSTFFGMMSTFDHLCPHFQAYMAKKGVAYRLAHPAVYGPRIKFLTKADFDIYTEAEKSPAIHVERDGRVSFEALLHKMEIDYTCYMSLGGSSYTVFSQNRLVELMFYCEFDRSKHWWELTAIN